MTPSPDTYAAGLLAGQNTLPATDTQAETEADDEVDIAAIPGPRVKRILIDALCTHLDALPADFANGDADVLTRAGHAVLGGAPDPSEVFDILIDLSMRDHPISVTTAGRPVKGAAIAKGSEIAFSADVPNDVFGDGEAIIFERDADGEVTVLSTYDIMHGDLTVGRTLEVPRRVPGLTGKLHLDSAGQVDILVLYIRDRGVRLWRHPLFQNTRIAPDQFGQPLRLNSVDPAAMRVLLRQVLGVPSSHWAIAQRQLSLLCVEKHQTYTTTTAQPLPQEAVTETTMNKPPLMYESTKGQGTMPNLKPDYSQLVSAHAPKVRKLAQINARYEYEGAGNRSVDKMIVKGMIANNHEFRARLDAAEDLIIVENKGNSVVQKAIHNSAFLGHHLFGLRYDGGTHEWVCLGEGETDDSVEPKVRAKTYYDRLMQGQMNSFPKTDTALVALSHGLPLELWEAESFAAFEQFADMERQRRRGTESVKPLLDFQPIDYLLALAANTTELDVFDDVEIAAGKGMLSACLELGKMPPREDRSETRLGRVEAPVLTVRPNAALWFRMFPPVRCDADQALLFFVSDETVEDDGVARRRVFLLSTHSAQNATTHFETSFESPTVARENYRLDANDSGELVLMFARSGDLSGETFFQRTRSLASDNELNDADLRDLQRAVLRRGPDQRWVYRRRIAVASLH